MDRLTKRLPNGVIKRTDLCGDSIMFRLAAFEDTGLTPEQVADLQGNIAVEKRRSEGYLWEMEQLEVYNTELSSDRDAWKRRAEAAEEEIRNYPGVTPCHACKHYRGRGELSVHCRLEGRTCFVWRGPRDKSKEEAE